MKFQRFGYLCALAFALSLALGARASAAVITFSTPVYDSANTDVLTAGALLTAYHFGNVDNASVSVNGVSFNYSTASSGNVGSYLTLGGSGWGNDNGNNFGDAVPGSPYAGLTTAYQEILEGNVYGGATGTITLNSLIVGHLYATQFWEDDSRNCCSARNETLNGGGNSVSVIYGNPLYPNGGGTGQFTIGTFTANATTQAFTLTAGAYSNPNNSGTSPVSMSAIQLRDVTNIGYWTGTGGAALDSNTTANFATNVYSAALTTATFSSASSLMNSVAFADYYYNSGSTTAVTQNNITIAAGGVSTGTVNFYNNAVNYTIASSDSAGFTGSTAVVLQGTGLVTLIGSNNYTGGTTISSGTLQLGDGTVGHDGMVSSAILNNSALVYNVYASQTANYAISGSGALTKIGGGTLTMGGANKYTTPTNILAGTLALGPTGSIATSPTIALASGTTFDVSAQGANYHLTSGQTLTGTGNFTVTGAMTANSSSILLAPATGLYRTLNVGSLTLNGGSTINFDIGSGSQDLINVSSANGLTVNGGGIDLYQGNGVSQITSFGTYLLMDYSGSISGAISNLSVLNPVIGDVYQFSATGGSLFVNFGPQSVWSGTGTNSNWSNAANWSNGVPGTGTPLIFSSSAGLSNVNDLTSFKAASVSFGSAAGAFTLSGNSIQLAGAITNSSTAAQTISLANIGLFGASQTINAYAGNITINSIISDGGGGLGITTSGANTVYLNAANTFSGPTSVVAGTLNLSNSLALQNSTLAAGTVVFDASVPSHAFTLGGLSTSSNLSLVDNGSNPILLSVGNNSTNTTYSGVLSGAGSLSKIGNGLLYLNNSNSITGSVVVSSGTLELAGNSTLSNAIVGASGTGALTFNSSVTSPTFAGLTGNGNITLPSLATTLTLNPASGSSPVFSGTLSGLNSNVSLNMNGPGAQTLSGSVTLGNNQLSISGGTLNLNGSLTNTGHLVLDSSTFNVNAGGTYTLTGPNQFTMSDNGGSSYLNIGGTMNIESTNGSDTLIGQNSPGTGTIHILSGGVLNIIGTGSTGSGFRMGNNGSSSPTGVVTMDPGSQFYLDGSNEGSNAFVLGNNSGATGIVNLNGGTLTTARNITTNGGGSGTFNFNGGMLEAGAASTSLMSISTANVQGGGAIINSNGYAITIGQTLVHSGANAVDGGLTVNDTAAVPGTLTLTAAETYTGPTNILSGTLILGSGGSINYSPTIAIANGATLNVTANSSFALLSGQTLTGTGNYSVAGAMAVNSGATIQPNVAGSSGTLSVGSLTLNTGSVLAYDLGGGQGLINVTNSSGLMVSGGSVGLYGANGSSPFSTPGTYTLADYSGALAGSVTNLSVLDPNAADTYLFTASNGSLNLTITAYNSETWNGAGSPSVNWSNSSNWAGSAVPSNGNILTFSGSTGLANNNDLTSLTAGGLVFTNSAGAFNLSGNSLQFSGAVVNNSTATQTIGLNLGLSGGNASFNAAAGNIVVSGVISDGGAGLGISMSGSGTLTLTASNSYSGGTTISAGVLQASTSNALGSGPIALNGGALTSTGTGSLSFANVFSLGGNATLGDPVNNGPLAFSGPVTIAASNPQLTVNSPVCISGSIGDNGNGWTLAGPSVLALTGVNNTITGTTTVNGGTLQLNGSSGPTLSGNLTVSGGTVQLLQSNQIATSQTITVSVGLLDMQGNSNTVSTVNLLGGLIDGTSNSLLNATSAFNLQSGTINASIGGVASLTLPSNAGVVTLNGNNSYQGSTNLNGGTLNVNGTHSSSNSFYVTNATVNINGTETLYGSNAQFWVAGTLSTVNISGTLDLNSSNSQLIGQEGNGTAYMNILPGGALNVTNGQFRLANTSYYTPTAVLTMYPGSQFTLDNQAGGTAFAIANASVTSADPIGTLNLNGGTLTTGRNIIGGFGTATVNFNGTLIVPTVSSSDFIDLSAGVHVPSIAQVRNGGAIFNTNGYYITIPQPLLHSSIGGDNAIDGGLTVYDPSYSPGELTLGGVNTYTGPTTVLNGTLALGASASIATSPTIALGNAAALDVSAQGANFHLTNGQTLTGTGSFTVVGAMTANSGSIILSASSGLFRTLNVGGLTLSPGSVLNYDIGGGSQDVINVTGYSGLTLNGGGIDLFQADGITPFSAPGTYTLLSYNGSLGGAVSNLSVLDPIGGDSYTFSDLGTGVALTIGVQDTWNGNGNPSFVWSNSSNWSTLQAPSNGNTLTFSGTQGLNNTNDMVSLNVGGLTFTSSAGAYTISGNSIQLSGPVVNSSTATQTLGLPIVLAGGNQTFSTLAGDIVVTGVIDDGGAGFGISKSGSATLTLAAANTYTGPTTITAGALNLANALAVQNSTVTVNPAGTLTFAASNTSPSLGGLAGSGNIALNTAASEPVALSVGGNGQSTTYSGILNGLGSLIKQGSGMLGLTNAQNYNGSTTVAGGILQLQGINASLPVSDVSVSAGATLDLNGISQYVTSLSGSGLLTNSNYSTPATFTVVGESSTFSGTIADSGPSGSLSLVDEGYGVLTLSGTNTYVGGTTVNSGTLVLQGAASLEAGTSLTIGAPSSGAVFVPPSAAVSGPAASPSLAPVPEPGTLALLATGLLLGIGLIRRGKRSNRSIK